MILFIRNEIVTQKIEFPAPIVEEQALQKICKAIHVDHQKHFQYLAKLLKFKTTDQLANNLSFLFRASEHNFSCHKFHEFCDGKGPTITIVRSTSKHLFGGYASISWNSNGGGSSAPGSFLFSLDKQTMHTIYRNEKRAILGNSNDGPVFGGGNGNDLVLSDQRYPKNPNWSHLGATYSLPEGVSIESTEARSYLAGDLNFGIEEYEVFGIEMNKDTVALLEKEEENKELI